jgi:hypothetical protein
MNIIHLSLLLFQFHPGLAAERENFCCRDGQTWITPDKVCDGTEDCPPTEIGDGGEDEERCYQEEGSGASDYGSDSFPFHKESWCIGIGLPAEGEPSISFIVKFNRTISSYNLNGHTTKQTVKVTILNCKNLPQTDTLIGNRDPDVKVQATITTATDSRLTNTTEVIMNDKNPVFNQTLQFQVDKDAQSMLKLTILDWDLSSSSKPIAEVELPLANSEGKVVTRRLDLEKCGGLNAVQCLVVNKFSKSLGWLIG